MGLILGKIGEQNFAQGMQMVHYDLFTYFSRPICAILIAAGALTLIAGIYKAFAQPKTPPKSHHSHAGGHVVTRRYSPSLTTLFERARVAQQPMRAMGTQALFDSACQAVAWSLMEPKRNRQLAELAVAQTGLGNADDKVRKNHNKTLGLMRDLKGVTAFGHCRG